MENYVISNEQHQFLTNGLNASILNKVIYVNHFDAEFGKTIFTAMVQMKLGLHLNPLLTRYHPVTSAVNTKLYFPR